MRVNRQISVSILHLLVTLLFGTGAINSQTLHFRHGSEVLYKAYKENTAGLEDLLRNVPDNMPDITGGKAVIRLVSAIPLQQKGNPAAMNLAAIRAAVVRQWLMDNNKELGEDHFAFYIHPTTEQEGVIVNCTDRDTTDRGRSELFFTLDKRDPLKIEAMLNRYKAFPLLDGGQLFQPEGYDFDFVNPGLDPTELTILTGGTDEKVQLTVYFRVNKEEVEPAYLTNARTLQGIDSLLRLKSAEYIDTLRIMAYASPEGSPEYNLKLSERRAKAFMDYMLSNYPRFNPSMLLAEGKGINWEGFRRLAETDPDLPDKAGILAILNNPDLTPLQRQTQLVNYKGGQIYKRYIFPNYYPKLRSGASLFIVYDPAMPVDINFEPIAVSLKEPEPEVIPEPTPEPEPEPVEEEEEPAIRYTRPFALKTNMLFDLATLFNVELEVPIGRHFSVLGEWTFPFWGGLGNAGGVAPIPVYSEKFTMQMLSGGLEARYWFPRSKGLDRKASRWGDYNPLNGWFVGIFGGAGLYDFQMGGNGMQGEFYIASGISAGFAHPIARHWHLEYSLGFGYIATRYYNYTMIEGHKVVDIRSDGMYDRRQQSLIGPTKLKVSLIWIPQFKTRSKK